MKQKSINATESYVTPAVKLYKIRTKKMVCTSPPSFGEMNSAGQEIYYNIDDEYNY